MKMVIKNMTIYIIFNLIMKTQRYTCKEEAKVSNVVNIVASVIGSYRFKLTSLSSVGSPILIDDFCS